MRNTLASRCEKTHKSNKQGTHNTTNQYIGSVVHHELYALSTNYTCSACNNDTSIYYFRNKNKIESVVVVDMKKYERQITKEEMKKHGAWFKVVRESLDLSKVAMAEMIGVYPTTIRHWERGKHVPQQDIHELIETYKYVLKKHGRRG